MTRTALRICPFCEATCGLTLTIEDGRVTGARGDRDDVFSAGFICPKGASFAELDNDPDRLAQPMVRRDGVLTEATWDEAFAARGPGWARSCASTAGRRSACISGNPNAHTDRGQPVPAVDHPRARHPPGVLGEHAGPDAQARGAGLDVR